MSDSVNNIIQIKRGEGKPSDGILMPYELGYDKTNIRLYIGDKDRKAIDLTPEIVTKANQLATARSIQTNLGSTAAVSFNGTEDVTPGVSGILSLTNGGLGVNASTEAGKTTARANLGINLSNLGITATAAQLNKMKDVTASASELNVLKGVTATTTELNYCDGVTSNIQTQLNGKQSTITGGISNVVTSNFTANRALTSNENGKIRSSSITSTELGYLSGVSSNIQTQLNNITTRLGKIKYDQLLAQNSSVSSCTWTGTYDFIIGMATAGSAVDSRSTFILPSSFLGNSNSFQVADESYYTSFNTTANSITRKAGSGGTLKCLYGIKII